VCINKYQTASSNLPGWAGPGSATFGTFAGGATCAWNASNDNDTWIKFTAQSTTVCINISGLDQNTQSIVVTDPNNDGDNNACTGAGAGQYWSLASCPRTSPALYGSTAGTDDNQNHCFTAIPGKTYYLVVDGNGGAESPFFVNGVLGTMFVLPVNLSDFSFTCFNNQIKLKWTTLSELNNDHFTVLGSSDGIEWVELDDILGAGSSNAINNYSYPVPFDYNQFKYFKLRQNDRNSMAISYSSILYVDCDKFEEIEFYPNPFVNELNFKVYSDGLINYEIVDLLGQSVSAGIISKQNTTILLDGLASDIYFLKINKSKTYKLIKQ